MMAKFNEYTVEAVDHEGAVIVGGQLRALGTEQAWHKAVALAFESVEPGTGLTPETIPVHRRASASEYHG